MSASSLSIPAYVPAWLNENAKLFRYKNGKRHLEIVTEAMRKNIKGLNAWHAVTNPVSGQVRRFQFAWEWKKGLVGISGFWRRVDVDDSQLPFERATRRKDPLLSIGAWTV